MQQVAGTSIHGIPNLGFVHVTHEIQPFPLCHTIYIHPFGKNKSLFSRIEIDWILKVTKFPRDIVISFVMDKDIFIPLGKTSLCLRELNLGFTRYFETLFKYLYTPRLYFI